MEFGSSIIKRKPWIVGASCALLILVAAPAWPQETAEGAPTQEALARDLADLDADDYETREHALARLGAAITAGTHSQWLAGEMARKLIDPQTSYEVRFQIEHLLGSAAPEGDAREADSAQIESLVKQLDDSSFARRVGARQRLDWLAEDPRLAGQILAAIKARLAEPSTRADTRRELAPARARARAKWLLSDPSQWVLPAVTDQQIAALVESVCRSNDRASVTNEHAQSELLDLLVRDDCASRVMRLLEERLAAGLEADAAALVREILDWRRPALVAEFWQRGRHLGIQHLLVGVPSKADTAARPSHFDRVDDQVAHCVSGNALSPGDYPVGVLFPHPRDPDAQFHLVNLPDARRRLAYECYVKTDPKQRLSELSRRTLDKVVSQRRHLRLDEFNMLRNLDPRVLSEFAGTYFQVVEDRHDIPEPGELAEAVTSHHGFLCAILAERGTQAAVPGILRAIEAKRLLEPNESAPYAMGWIALLAIAQRDPWPEVDSWLAESVTRQDLLYLNEDSAPSVGATAAAILLVRHDEKADKHGLAQVSNRILKMFGFQGYRFESSTAGESLLRWWQERSNRTATAP